MSQSFLSLFSLISLISQLITDASHFIASLSLLSSFHSIWFFSYIDLLDVRKKALRFSALYLRCDKFCSTFHVRGSFQVNSDKFHMFTSTRICFRASPWKRFLSCMDE